MHPTPGLTAAGGVPGCWLHGEARVTPHPPACAVYRIPYMSEMQTRKFAFRGCAEFVTDDSYAHNTHGKAGQLL